MEIISYTQYQPEFCFLHFLSFIGFLQQIIFLLQPIMASSSNPSDDTLPMATILHVISIKLHSSNYLLWRNQMIPLLSYQKLMSHVDGSAASPSATIIADNKELPNPVYTTWLETDQQISSFWTILFLRRLPLKLLDFLLLHTVADAGFLIMCGTNFSLLRFVNNS